MGPFGPHRCRFGDCSLRILRILGLKIVLGLEVTPIVIVLLLLLGHRLKTIIRIMPFIC